MQSETRNTGDVSLDVHDHLLRVTNILESKIDEDLEKYARLDNMTRENFETEMISMREKRLAAMKKEAEARKAFINKGHGVYTEFETERQFFEATKPSEKVVIHFGESVIQKCLIVDHLLKIMSSKHLETRFLKVELHKVPFLRVNFEIDQVPTIIVVINHHVKGKLTNFEEIKDGNDFSYKMLEWKIARVAGINYDEDLNTPPEEKKACPKTIYRTIRENDSSEGED